MSTNVNVPKNSLVNGWWWTVFISGLATWGFSVASIGVAASAYVKYNNLKNSIVEAAAPATIEITSPDLLPTGIIVLILSCVLCFFLMFLLGHLLLHRPSTREPATRGFHSVPNYYWAFTLLLSVLLLFSMVAVGFYDRYFARRSARIHGHTPDGQEIPPLVLEAFLLQTTGRGPRYNNFGFLKAVGVVPWLTNFLGLILIFALWIASDDAARFPDAVDDPVSSSHYAAANTNAPSVPTELSGTQAAVDSSTGTAPVVTREKDVTDREVATKEKEAQQEPAVTSKDLASNV